MKVGVIGTGNMGENHLRTYLSMYEHCQVAGVYDNDEQKRSKIAQRYNLKSFQTVEELLRSVDAVSIAVPTELHHEVGLTCIRHNVHMLMEKPLVSTIQQADDLIEKASSAGVKIQTGHIELYNPFIQVLLNVLKTETITGIGFYRISPSGNKVADVNVVKDLMIHDIYILNEILQESTKDFHAMGKVINQQPRHATAITRTPQGITAHLTASYMSGRKVRIVQIITENAYIEADILNHTITITRTFNELTNGHPIPLTQTIQVENSIQPLQLQLLDFIHCIESQIDPSVPGEHGKQVLMIADQVTESILYQNNLPY